MHRVSDQLREASQAVTGFLLTTPNRPRTGKRPHVVPRSVSVGLHGFVPQDLFARLLYLERKRSERSGRSFVLMLLESSKLLKTGTGDDVLARVLQALSESVRDTDVVGWYQEDASVGVIFTELGSYDEGRAVASALLTKVTGALSSTLSINEINEIRLSFRVFPDDWEGGAPEMGPELYDGLFHRVPQSRLSRFTKRSMDIAGSLLALFLDLPLFVVIAMAIKLTSRGPVFFRQTRVGGYGREFTFLKFRSMYCNNDHSIHLKYVRQFIADETGGAPGQAGQAQYKIADDPRVTRIGRFLRRTSLDELPQFLNVLRGDMSLVGPRPPLPYEVDCYRHWHWARLSAAKPGITGIWQVSGRSRVKFDDMVRMDLQYANSQSLWLDLKILLRTPQAMISGAGAR
jgi:exopolysaccharide biosynthesis polyprenyl glycosylphosphotransferase